MQLRRLKILPATAKTWCSQINNKQTHSHGEWLLMGPRFPSGWWKCSTCAADCTALNILETRVPFEWVNLTVHASNQERCFFFNDDSRNQGHGSVLMRHEEISGALITLCFLTWMILTLRQFHCEKVVWYGIFLMCALCCICYNWIKLYNEGKRNLAVSLGK